MTDVESGDELVVTRVFDAPRALVFRCLVEPEHLARFWGPSGTQTPIAGILVDPHSGGTFETTMVSDSDGSRYTMRAVYLEVRESALLAWRDQDSGVTTTATFRDLDDSRTEVEIRQRNVPEAYRTPQARAGFLTSLDRLDVHLADLFHGQEHNNAHDELGYVR